MCLVTIYEDQIHPSSYEYFSYVSFPDHWYILYPVRWVVAARNLCSNKNAERRNFE